MMDTMSANIIDNNILVQYNEEGEMHTMLYEIIDHLISPGAVKITDRHYENNYGFKRRKRTASVWEVYIKWKDRSIYWVAMNI